MRANLLGNYLLGLFKHQEFLNVMKISEMDLFCIDKVEFKNRSYFDCLDFGNNDSCFLSIKSFGEFQNLKNNFIFTKNGLKLNSFSFT